jgi:transitional endoplasmic reticulum ATPase
MNRRTSSKPLTSIPRDVYISALQSRPGLVGQAFRWVHNSAGFALALTVFAAPSALLTWVACLFVDDPGKLRLTTTAFFGGLFALSLVYHCLELFMAIPWKDRSYPVLLRRSFVYSLLVRSGHGFSLSVTTAVYSALLWLAWGWGWQGASGQRNTVTYAALNTGLAAAMYLYGRIQPYGAFRAPSRPDLQWMASDAPTALVRGQATVAPSTPAAKATSQVEYATPIIARPPRLSFNDIVGMQDVKHKLLGPAREIVADRVSTKEPPPNGILLHGAPGNGKTIFAEALAGELQVPLVALTYGDVSSKWLGEMPRLISNCFAYAKDQAPCVLFVDEIDSFLRSRSLGSGNSEDLKIVNTLLTEIVAVREHQVVLVGATNYLENLDPAATREGRFDLKVEVTAPDEPARLGVLRASVTKYAGSLQVEEDALCSVAKRWDGFSVSRLVAICKALPECARETGSILIGFDQWHCALRLVQGSKARAPAGSKRLDELVLPAPTRNALLLVAARLRDVHRIESMGGTLPTGILLYGAPGTGKTAAARALALESGWAFLSVAGPELLSQRDRLSRLYAEALELRPTIVFVDEADDVIADRRFAAAPDLVNRLLTTMDGTLAKAPDVVFVAATNHPDRVDPALLRAGRFTEKIEFTTPTTGQVARFVQAWLQSKRVRLDIGLDAHAVAIIIGRQTIADTQGVLQYSLNCAIQRAAGGKSAVLTRGDVYAALAVVCTNESPVAGANRQAWSDASGESRHVLPLSVAGSSTRRYR